VINKYLTKSKFCLLVILILIVILRLHIFSILSCYTTKEIIMGKGENELKIPTMLERDNEEEVAYTVRAQIGKTEIFDGVETNTYGYNGTFLGPMQMVDRMM